MNIYIVRHGQTDWNVQKRLQGRTDTELNSCGIEQAKQVSENLKNEKIDLIICSPLKRAKQTAEIINVNRNIPIIYDDKISERNLGELEGKTQDEFDVNAIFDYNNSKYNIETSKDLFKRVYTFLDDIKNEYPNKNILLVTHGGVSAAVNCYFNGIPENNNLKHLGLKNCEYAKYEF